MKVAYFDCLFGAAGDMLCATLLASGLDEQAWLAEIAKLSIGKEKFEVEVENVLRCSILAKKMTVKYFEHHHDNDSDHDSGHHHDNGTEHQSGHDHAHGRSFKDIGEIIERSQLSPGAKLLAQKIFSNLAEAEARVHGVRPEDIHFHEVGAVDAIVDIVGFAIGYDMLGIDQSVVSPLTLGHGIVQTEHGAYPVPGPAVLYLIVQAGAPTTSLDLTFECLTPTGAAILTTIADRWGAAPAFEKIHCTGYGAGSYDPSSHPNTTRGIIGECAQIVSTEQANGGFLTSAHLLAAEAGHVTKTTGFKAEVIAVIEANIDDCPPNVLAYALEKALAEGALDVSVVPATMKKSRSGHLVSVLAKPEDRRKLERLMLEETSTIGVRTHFVERLVAEREFVEVKLSDACSIKIKIARDTAGNIINIQPEHSDCAKFAETNGVPLKEVLERALLLYQELR